MLKTQNLTQTFGELMANDKISLEFGAERGEVVFIIGPNGAGKTTFVEMLAGNLAPTNGKILLDGEDITDTSPRDRVDLGIGKSFQIANVFEESTVRENHRMAALSKHDLTGKVLPFEDSYEHIEDEVDEQLANFGLEEVADIRADKLSHGDRKILDVAIAYALDLEYMFLDEPTAGVVTEKKHDLIETVLAMTREELEATVVIEHDMDLVTEHGDRVIALQEGEVFRDGPPSILKTDDELRRTLLGIEG